MGIVVAATALAVANVRSDEIGGVGVAVRVEEGKVLVAKILPDTSAAKSRKLQMNDRILAIGQGDGQSINVDGKSLTGVVKLLRGPIGSAVHLTIVPAGKSEAEAYVLQLERADLNLPLALGSDKRAVQGTGTRLELHSEAPNFRFESLEDGQVKGLADFRGKVVVLEFWATWCAPCQKAVTELQSFVKSHSRWKGECIYITASLDDRREVARVHAAQRGWSETLNAWTGSAVSKLYEIDSIPMTVVIDAGGKVVAMDNYVDLEKVLASLLRR